MIMIYIKTLQTRDLFMCDILKQSMKEIDQLNIKKEQQKSGLFFQIQNLNSSESEV